MSKYVNMSVHFYATKYKTQKQRLRAGDLPIPTHFENCEGQTMSPPPPFPHFWQQFIDS